MKPEAKKVFDFLKTKYAKVVVTEDNGFLVTEGGDTYKLTERDAFHIYKQELERKHSDCECFDKKRRHLELIDEKVVHNPQDLI